MLRAALLLPRSTLFPAFGIDILNGIKSCLKHNGVQQEIDVRTDNIGFGLDEADIYTKAEKFLLQEDVDLVMVVADVRICELLEPLFTATNKILMMVNTGANFPETWQGSPTTLVHSANFCLHTHLTGRWLLMKLPVSRVFMLFLIMMAVTASVIPCLPVTKWQVASHPLHMLPNLKQRILHWILLKNFLLARKRK